MALDLYDEAPPVQKAKLPLGNILLVAAVALLAFLLLKDKVAIPSIIPGLSSDLTVLIVEDENGRRDLEAEVLAAYLSDDVGAWLDSNCVDSKGERTWRLVDQNLDISQDAEIFAKLKAMPRSKVPWIYISPPTGKVESFPCKSKDDTLERLKKYKQ